MSKYLIDMCFNSTYIYYISIFYIVMVEQVASKGFGFIFNNGMGWKKKVRTI